MDSRLVLLLLWCFLLFVSAANARRNGRRNARTRAKQLWSEDDEEYEREWKRFKQRKHYRNKEEAAKRYGVFKTNLKRIKAHTEKYRRGESAFEMAVNEFSDLTPREFGDMMTGGARHSDDPRVKGGSMYRKKERLRKEKGKETGEESGEEEITDDKKTETETKTVDWRQSGCISPVKNQLTCGSCYAFAATGALEAYYCLNTGEHILLSEQNLVDCTRPFGNMGCDWGWAHNCWMYIKEIGGINTQQEYPYVNQDTACTYRPYAGGVEVKDFVSIPRDESVVEEVVTSVGPVTISVYISPDMQFYKSGILDDPQCHKSDYTHAMLIVGYGKQGSDEYWIVKNSWGDQWGEDGYIRMTRNKRNQCDVAGYAKYVVV